MKIGIYGYGNLGKGVELAIRQNPDMELFGIFTRRNPKTVKTLTGAPVYAAEEAEDYAGEIDAMIICGGSASDLPEMTPMLAQHFNVVDSFDTHAKVPEHFANVDRAAFTHAHTAIISAGWDPGLFSLARLYMNIVLGPRRQPGPQRRDPPHPGREGRAAVYRARAGSAGTGPQGRESGTDHAAEAYPRVLRGGGRRRGQGADREADQGNAELLRGLRRDREFHHRRGDEAGSYGTAARRTGDPLRLYRGRGAQARDGVFAEAGFQSGVHGLGAGSLREGGRPDERAGDLRLQDAV